VQDGDQLALAPDRLPLLDAAVGVLLERTGAPGVDLSDERRNLGVALLDDFPQLDDVDEVVHGEQAQSADGVRAVRLVDGLGLEEGLGQPLLAPTHEVERWDVVLDLERGRLGCGYWVQRKPDGPCGQDSNGHDGRPPGKTWSGTTRVRVGKATTDAARVAAPLGFGHA
jgi:hypothetical protein